LSSNIIDYVRVKQNSNRQDINKILQELLDLNAQDPEDAALQERIALSDGIRKRISTLIEATGADIFEDSGPRDRRSEAITMDYPLTCQTFPHVVTENGTITFAAGVEDSGTRFGGRGTFGGTNEYITLSHIASSDLDLERTDAHSIAFWFKRPNDTSLDGLFGNRSAFGATDIGISISLSTTGQIVYNICDGTTELQVVSAADLDDDLWHSVVCTYDGSSNRTGMNVYIDDGSPIRVIILALLSI